MPIPTTPPTLIELYRVEAGRNKDDEVLDQVLNNNYDAATAIVAGIDLTDISADNQATAIRLMTAHLTQITPAGPGVSEQAGSFTVQRLTAGTGAGWLSTSAGSQANVLLAGRLEGLMPSGYAAKQPDSNDPTWGLERV